MTIKVVEKSKVVSGESRCEFDSDSSVLKAEVRGIFTEPHLSRDKVRASQLSNPSIGWIVRTKEKLGGHPSRETVSAASSAHKTLWSSWDQ